MRPLITVIAILLVAVLPACKKTSDSNEKDITGKWKLTETLMSTGGPIVRKPADPQHPVYISFYSNGTFINNGYFNDVIDRYTISNDSTHIVFTSSTTTDTIHNGFTVDGKSLTLMPLCIEPCSAHFVRVKDLP